MLNLAAPRQVFRAMPANEASQGMDRSETLVACRNFTPASHFDILKEVAGTDSGLTVDSRRASAIHRGGRQGAIEFTKMVHLDVALPQVRW